MSVEYIISERLFETLPKEEKKLWHSHLCEVKSRALLAPGLAKVARRDKRYDISTVEKKKNRLDITVPNVDPLANAWEMGELRQFVITNKVDSALQMHQGAPIRNRAKGIGAADPSGTELVNKIEIL